jgi:hypothetical protein
MNLSLFGRSVLEQVYRYSTAGEQFASGVLVKDAVGLHVMH